MKHAASSSPARTHRKTKPLRTKNIPLPGFKFSSRLSFGGNRLKGNPKVARPVVTKQAMHFVLRSTQATGAQSFLAHRKKIEDLLSKQAKAFGIRLYDVANAGNHLHVVLRAFNRACLKGFLRSITGLIARMILGIQRGPAREISQTGTHTFNAHSANASSANARAANANSTKGFWDARPFSRIVAWGKDYKQLRNYLMLNRVELLSGFDRLSARAMLKAIALFEHQPGLTSVGFT